MPTRLQDKRVLITGASSGIGEAAAREFARQGAEVVIVSEQAEALHAVAASIRKAGGRVTAVVVDLSKPEQVRGVIPRIEADVGPLDVLVNNAGIGLGATIMETQQEKMRLLFEVNFFALAELCKQALTAMSVRRSGRIINISSAAALFGSPTVSAYSATKGAVHAYSMALRTEAVIYGVHVSEVLPVSVRTRFFDSVHGEKYKPSGVMLTSEKVAQSIVQCAAAARPPAEVQPYYPIRFIFILTALFPSLMARIAAHLQKKSVRALNASSAPVSQVKDGQASGQEKP
jgi:short-subunit dehydrogenase